MYPGGVQADKRRLPGPITPLKAPVKATTNAGYPSTAHN